MTQPKYNFNQTGSGFMEDLFFKSINNIAETGNKNLIEILRDPPKYIKRSMEDSKQKLLIIIREKLDEMSSDQINFLKTTHPELSPDESYKILMKHNIYYSILFSIIKNYMDGSINFLTLSEDKLKSELNALINEELEKYDLLNVSPENIMNDEMLLELKTNLLNHLIEAVPTIVVKLIVSLFPLVNTPTVMLNLAENEANAVAKLITKTTVKATKELLEINNNKTGGFLKKNNKYSKKYYIKRIRKTLKSFYRR